MKLYSALGAFGPYPFDSLWPDVSVVHLPEDIERDPGVLVLWGGEDISPSLYNEKPNRFTGADDRPSQRDRLEVNLAHKAIQLGYPIIGICRGAQLMCALSGGRVIQHVENHGRSHDIKTNDGRIFTTTSVHHQMLYPFDIDHTMIAWSAPARSPHYIGEDGTDGPRPTVEPEVVYFPQSKAITIQGHPEFIPNIQNAFVQYSLELARKYCNAN